jgi:hypothetical protein
MSRTCRWRKASGVNDTTEREMMGNEAYTIKVCVRDEDVADVPVPAMAHDRVGVAARVDHNALLLMRTKRWPSERAVHQSLGGRG